MVHVYFTNKSNYLFHKDDVDTCIMNRTHDQELAALVELKEVLRFFLAQNILICYQNQFKDKGI